MRSAGMAFLELLGWSTVAVAGLVMIGQALGRTGVRVMAVVQSLTPYLALAMAPLAVAALAGGSAWLALTAAVVGMGGLVLAWPILFVAARPAVAEDAQGIRIASVNLYYGNEQVDEVAPLLLALDADVIAFAEYTPEHQRALRASELGDAFDHKVDRPGHLAGGTAIWSRTPLVERDPLETRNHSVDAIVEGHHGSVRVLAVHPPTPIHDFDDWRRDLRRAGRSGRQGDTPTVIVGDLNAAYWHPTLRELLRSGYTDAHIANGRGLSVSWPMDRRLPPFVRLDHALTTDALVPTDVEDFVVVGSDHRGFVVTVAPAR